MTDKEAKEIDKKNADAMLPSVNTLLEEIDEYHKKDVESVVNIASNIERTKDDVYALLKEYNSYIETIEAELNTLKKTLDNASSYTGGK